VSLFTLGKLEIRGGVKTIVTSNEALAATNPVLQQFRRDLGNAVARQVDRDIMSSLYGLPVITSKYLPPGTVVLANCDGPVQGRKAASFCFDDIPFKTLETSMATKTTKQLRVRLYDGPHHGRILLVPSNQRVFLLPNPMPAGEMWGAGRSNPGQFTNREYTYELRTPLNGGEPYLGYVEAPRASFVIPQAPKKTVKVTEKAEVLLTKLVNESYNIGVGSNGTRAERMAKMQNARFALASYISEIERESYSTYRQFATFIEG
jgi:hypothetical protein